MKPQSNKAKGRKLQQWVRDRLISILQLTDEDVRSTSMGAGGEDVTLSTSARKVFPLSVECKNVEKVNVWQSYKQATENSKGYEPLLVIKKNHHKPLAVVDAEYFIGLFNEDTSS